MSLKYSLSVTGLALALLASGCSTANRTVVTGSWHNPDLPAENFNRILVLGLSENQSARAVVEQTLVDELSTAGYNAATATQTYTVAELREMKDNRALADQRLAEAGFDGIMIISVLDIKEETYYVPGTVSYHPTAMYPHYGGYYGYWGTTYSSVYSPGYYENSLSIFLETNLYVIEDEVLVWSAQSETEDPSSVQSLAETFARVLVDDLIENKVIAPTSS